MRVVAAAASPSRAQVLWRWEHTPADTRALSSGQGNIFNRTTTYFTLFVDTADRPDYLVRRPPPRAWV
jgi:hypothetical protein